MWHHLWPCQWFQNFHRGQAGLVKGPNGGKMFNVSSLSLDGCLVGQVDSLHHLIVTQAPKVKALHLLQHLVLVALLTQLADLV